MITRNRILAMLLALALLLSALPMAAFSANALETYVIDRSLKLALGDNSLTLDANAITTIYEFKPSAAGIYRFTAAEADALVGYWGAGTYFVFDQTQDKTNTIEVELKNVGPSIMIGISGVSSCTLKVENLGDSAIEVEPEWEQYVNVHTPTAFTMPNYCDMRSVNVLNSKINQAIMGSDGFYHLDAADGPLLVVDFAHEDLSLQAAHSYGQVRRYYFDDAGKTVKKLDFYDSLEASMAAADGTKYPVTEDIKTMLVELGDYKGWYVKSEFGSYMFENSVVNPDEAWMFICYYLQPCQLKYVEEVPATTESAGTHAHWKCTVCATLYADAEGQKIVEKADLEIPQLTKAEIYADAYDMTYYVGGYGATGSRYQCGVRYNDYGYSEWFDISFGDPIVENWPTEAGTHTVTFEKTVTFDATYTFEVTMNITVLELPATSGKCGDDITWSFDADTYTLTLSGTGDMYLIAESVDDYWNGALNYTPGWWELPVKHVVVEEGIENLSSFAFTSQLYTDYMQTLQLPGTLKAIPQYALFFSSNIKTLVIPEGVTSLTGWPFGSPGNSFGALTDLYLPASLTEFDYLTLLIAGLDSRTAQQTMNAIHYTGNEKQWNAIARVDSDSIYDIFGDDYDNFYENWCVPAPGFVEKLVVCEGVDETGLQIVKQPAAQSVSLGSNAIFSVEATGDGLTYRWQYSKDGGATWLNATTSMSGYKSDTLALEATKARNGYLLRCKVTDRDGNEAFSEAAALTVEDSVTFTAHPQPETVKLGNRAAFTVEARGDIKSYQWQYQMYEDGPWWNCTPFTMGYNTTVLNVIAAQLRQGFLYRCRITDSLGNKYYSDTAELTVDIPETYAILSQPQNAWVMPGNTTTFHVDTQGEGLTYQWEYHKGVDKTGPEYYWIAMGSTTGCKTDTLTIAGISGSTNRDGWAYRCVITDKDGYIYTTDHAFLYVADAQIDSQPEDQTVTQTGMANFHVEVSGEVASYQWQYSKDGGNSWFKSSSATQGYNTDTLTVAGVSGATNRDGFLYRCVITDASGNVIYSAAAQLNVLN